MCLRLLLGHRKYQVRDIPSLFEKQYMPVGFKEVMDHHGLVKSSDSLQTFGMWTKYTVYTISTAQGGGGSLKIRNL